MRISSINHLFRNALDDWLFFTISPKAKFALKVALTMTLTYLFILANELEYASVAIFTIMLIASPDGVKDSLNKGLLRIGGTIVGAIVGITLILLFPQHPFAYLLSLSFVVTLFLYLRSAYTGDETLFMLAAMTAMAVFDGGEVSEVFLYGVNRTLITILAIVIYTLVFFLIWPSKGENSPKPQTSKPSFIWLVPEHIKGAIQAFIVFWIATLIWYFLNPPGGFILVMLATGLSALTSFNPIKPSVMAFLINVSLAIAIILYIFVLPNLTHWIELSILLFFYTFFAFYFFPPMLSVIILIGMNTLMITNTMSYNVDLFLGIVLIMDMVFALLILIYYVPFSAKPEYLYPKLVKRLIRLNALRFHTSSIIRRYVAIHLPFTLEQLEIWGTKIDLRYFSQIHAEKIEHVTTNFSDLTKTIEKIILSTSDQKELTSLFDQWIKHLESPSNLISLDNLTVNASLYPIVLKCHQSLGEIAWDHLKEGRF